MIRAAFGRERALPTTSETIIRPVSGWFDVDLKSIWRYRDLVYLMVRRDFVAQYAQTILGPLWFVVQPLLTTIMFTLVFGRVARLPTDGIPPTLFYMAGVVAWGYFSTCVTKTSTTFVANAHLFGKVWFPRLVVPISVVLSGLVALVIQIGLFSAMFGWRLATDDALSVGSRVWLVPLLVLQMGLLSLGCGIVISSLTTRYRDLANLVVFGVQLWMFATPVVYPASRIPENWIWLMFVNPMAPLVEALRLSVFGVGTVTGAQLCCSLGITLCLLAAGVVLFSRIEKSFMDSV